MEDHRLNKLEGKIDTLVQTLSDLTVRVTDALARGSEKIATNSRDINNYFQQQRECKNAREFIERGHQKDFINVREELEQARIAFDMKIDKAVGANRRIIIGGFTFTLAVIAVLTFVK